MSTYNEQLQQNNAELEEILRTAQSLPDATPDGTYIPIPETAEVGQTIRVSAVDENGKPTAWEAADFPSGGGGGFEIIASGELTEETTQIIISTDNSGNPFELLVASFGIKIEGSSANSANGQARIRTNTNTAALGGQVMFGNCIRTSGSAAQIAVWFSCSANILLKGYSTGAGNWADVINTNYDRLTAIYIAGTDSGKQTFGVGTKWVLRGIRA